MVFRKGDLLMFKQNENGKKKVSKMKPVNHSMSSRDGNRGR